LQSAQNKPYICNIWSNNISYCGTYYLLERSNYLWNKLRNWRFNCNKCQTYNKFGNTKLLCNCWGWFYKVIWTFDLKIRSSRRIKKLSTIYKVIWTFDQRTEGLKRFSAIMIISGLSFLNLLLVIWTLLESQISSLSVRRK